MNLSNNTPKIEFLSEPIVMNEYVTHIRSEHKGVVKYTLGPIIRATTYDNAVLHSRSLPEYPTIEVIGRQVDGRNTSPTTSYSFAIFDYEGT